MHERTDHRSTVKILAFFKDISSGAKQNPVTRNAVVHLIPEQIGVSAKLIKLEESLALTLFKLLGFLEFASLLAC